MIGRKLEQEQLLNAYNNEESNFVAVYGRRRVGKTYLIRQTFKDRFTFCHTGNFNSPKEEQIELFCNSLENQGYKDIKERPTNWIGAFFLLEKFIISLPKEGKKIIFLDELSCMDTPNSRFVPSLEHFWNGFASARDDILLIVCASSTSWIINNIIHNRGGLHNRLNANIYLNQFTLKECREYIDSRNIVMNNHQLLECYMIMGGVPFYWSLLNKGFSVNQNIDKIFFGETSLLKDEFSYLYKSIFDSPDQYISVIKAFNTKKVGLTRDEIIKLSGLPNNGHTSEILTNLDYCGFIRCYNMFGHSKRNCLYQLIDNFTLFYFNFLENKPNDKHFWQNSIGSAKVTSWKGLAFERVCLQHIDQIKDKLGISAVLTNVCSWYCKKDAEKGLKGCQIDLLIVRADQVINLCEMKYSVSDFTITKSVDENIRNKVNDLKTATKTKYAIHKTIITTYGLEKSMYSDEIQSVVTAEDLMI